MVPSLLALVLLHIVFGLATSTLNSNVCKLPLTAKTTSTSNSQAVNNGEWCGQQGQANWVEFDFGTHVGIREIVIGKPANSMQGYVTDFNIQFVGTQSQTLQNYGSDPNKATVIKTGLNDQVGSSTITLTGVAVSKFRINIVNYSKQPCLKIDLHGCTNSEELCPPGCQNGGACVYEETCACARGFEGHSCEKAISHSGACMSPLGMANSGIPDTALSASSSNPGHGKEKARYGCCTGTNGGAWCPAIGDKTPWYEVSFDKPQTVSAMDFIYPWYPRGTVATEYMKSFELQFWSALDPVKSWRTFAKDVPSIYNDTLYYTISLQPSIVVNAIRILPLSYKKEPCIRFEVLGCDPKGLCSASYCQNGGSCMGENICLCTRGYYGARCEHTANQLLTLNAGFQTIAHQILQTTSTIKFTVHGNPTLVSTSTGHAIHITSNSQYLVIDKTGFTSCLSDLDKCTNGFTITTNVHFTTLTDNTYIISSGGNLPNTKGIALYYLSGNIHFVVSTSTKTWHLVIPHKLTLNVWHHLELSWNQNLGCELVDNGKLVGSVTQPVPHQATIVKQIAIGHGYTQSTTHISMKVEGFKTVDANRASLVVAGIVTPAVSATTHTSPTPTTTVAMTTEEPTTTVTTNQMTTVFSCGAKEKKFDFMAIKGNVLVTPEYNFTVYKNPTIRPENNGHAVLILNTTGQYVELPNKGIECIQDMTKCESGFTLSLEIKWLDMNSTNKRYIFSSGGDKVNNSGLALYLWQGELYCSAKKDKQIWVAKSKLNVKAGEWHSYQVSWNKKDGFVVYLDGHIFMEHTMKLPNPAQPGTFPLLIATTPGYKETSLMEVRNLYTWTASRDVLINNTCITEFPTLPPTTTAYHFTFIKIGHNIMTTTAFNLSVHGNPQLEHHSFTRNPILVLNGSNQYVEFSNNSNIGCLNNLAVCQSGFTIEVDVSLTKVNQQQKTMIISNSNQYLNGTGMALYFFNGLLYGYVSTSHQTWKVDFKFKVDMDKYHKYQISWSVTHGLTLFIDGHQVASTTYATTHKYTLTQHSLTIGKLDSVSYTTSMKLTALTIWQASHQVLIQQGTLTTAMPTTTTLAPTTTKMDIPKFEWNFVKIPHSQTIIGSMFNATVHGTVNVNTSLGFNFNNTNQYIDLGVHSNLCFGNLSLCSCGLTIKITIMFTKLEENTVIISSGAEQATGTGLAMVYRYGQIHCMVSTATDSWFTEFSREKFIYHQVHQVIITWSPAHGLKVIINNYVISSVTKSIKHRAIKSFTEHMYIGNTPTVKSLTSCNYFMSSVIIWHCWIDNIVGEGELTTPIPETTTASVTTPVKTAPPTSPAPALTTQFCKTGYVCKDDLSTHPTWKPTNPNKQPTSLKQTLPTNPPTKKPTKPTKPTTPKPTAKPTTPRPTSRPTTPKPTKKPTTPKPTTQKPTKPTTRPTTPKPTTPRPSRPSYVTIPHLRPGVSNTGVAYFSCQFEKSKQPNVEFEVCLNINGNCEKKVLVGGSYQEVKFTIVEINQNLFKKQITCTVQAKWKGQNPWTPIKTSNIITPDIKIVTGNLVLTEGHTTEHLVVNVTAPPQMFCCQGCQGNCKVTITAHANFERFYQRCTSHKYIPEVVVGWAGTSQSPDQNQCGTSVSQTTHISSWQQIIKIPVKATVDGRIDRNTHNQFTVQGHVVNQPKPSITIKPHTLNVGQVQITANNGDHHAQCKSLNDPHMTTFDGRRYDNHNGGEFTLYKHTSLPYEVRAFYTKCSSRGRAYCNCGAAIKSGDDVITFQTCQRSGNNGQGHGHGGILGFLFNGHGHGHHHHSTPARISVELYKNGELTPGTQIRRIGCGQKYQVILPTGTVVTVQSSGTQFINIWINPSSVDRGQTEGLCGSYDGNRYNDVFYPSNGRPDNNKNPTRFCMKWKQSQTIFYGVSAEKYNYINTFCSCIQNKDVFCNRGHGIMTCAKSRYDITSTILRQAKIPNIGHRHRRDVAEDDTVLTTTVMPVQTNITTINYTSAEAYNRCKELVEQNKAVQTCWSTVNNTLFNTSMENCAADLVDSGDEVWANGYITDVVEECLNTLANQQQIVDGQVMLPNDTEAVNTTELCQQDCGQHGECIEGVCRCAAGYSGLSCDVSAEDTVPTMIIQPAGTGSCGCDRRITDDCNTVTVYGDNFVESTTLTCHYEFTQGPLFGKPATLGRSRSATAQYVSINQVTCTLPEVNDGVYISISNNGQGYSSDWYLHTVYDSLCFDCASSGQSSPAIQYNRKNFTCVINGQCFAANDKKPDDECKSCDSSNSDNKWTDSSDKSCKCSSETEVSKVGAEEDSVYNKQTVTILAVVIGILCFITMVSLFYNCKLRSKRSLYRKKEYATDDAFNHPQKKNFENPGYSYEQSENVKM